MLAFHGKPELKEQLLNQLQAHYDADEIVKGQYWENGKGCALGCALHLNTDVHLAYRDRYGINCLISGLQDIIFEMLPNKESKEFPIEFTKAVPVGANLDKVFYKWSIRMLLRVRPLALNDGRKAIDRVIELFRKPELITYADADAAAHADADAAAHAVAAARAARAARAACIAHAAAVAAEIKNQKNDLLELLEETKLLNIKETAAYLGIKDSYFRSKISRSCYEPLKNKRVIISGKTFFKVEDLLRIKKN